MSPGVHSGMCMARVPLPMMVPLPTSVSTPCSPAYDGTCALCPLGSQGLQLLWLVALSFRTPAGGSPLLAENAKAYFKRAKAHAAVWNEREAREDFLRVAHLDPSMAAAVKKELKQLGERMRKKHVEDRKRYQGLFQPPQGPRASEEQESREVGDRAMLQEEAPRGEAGVLETPGQGEQGAGTKEAEQPGADQAEQGTPGAGCEGAVPRGEATQGQPAGVEVEARDGMGLGEEANLGICGPEPESWGVEGGAEEEDEKEEEGEEVEKEEEEGEKEEEEKVESSAAEMEKLALGQCGAAGGTETAGLEQGASGAERAGTGSVALAEPGRAPEPGPPSKGLGPAEGPPDLEDKTPREALEEGSCREQQAGSGQGNAGEGNIPPDSFTPGAVLQAGHSGADEELGRGAEVPPCPIAAREGSDAPPGQCSESRAQGCDPGAWPALSSADYPWMTEGLPDH